MMEAEDNSDELREKIKNLAPEEGTTESKCRPDPC